LKALARETSFVGHERKTPVDRNRLAWFMKTLRDYNKRNKADDQHIGPLTRTTLEVAQVLFTVFLRPDGRCDPSHADIARVVGCHRNTVAAAMAALETTGLLTWSIRFYRLAVGGIRRSTHGYRFRIPDAQKSCRSETAGESLPLSQRPCQPILST
jgi:hypothetical protein